MLTKIVMLLLSFSDNFLQENPLIFQEKSVHNFEIAHKTSLFLVSGAVTLPLKRMKHDPEKAKFHFFFFGVISLLASGFNNLSVFLKEWFKDYHAYYFPWLDFFLILCLLMLDNLNFKISLTNMGSTYHLRK